jgi:hypothetical protein
MSSSLKYKVGRTCTQIYYLGGICIIPNKSLRDAVFSVVDMGGHCRIKISTFPKDIEIEHEYNGDEDEDDVVSALSLIHMCVSEKETPGGHRV